jgi:hypothetical protein
VACLALPLQHAADAVGDAANQDRERPYYATYFDDPAKPPLMNRARADGLALMRALQSLGMVDEAAAPDTIINGVRAAGGATFRLKQQYKVLIDPRRPGCLPIANLTPEVKAIRWRTLQYGGNEPQYHLELIGLARASEPRSWVKETGAEAKLPILKTLIDEGLPYSAQVRHDPKNGWMVGTAAVPNIAYAGTEKPAALFALLPRFADRPAAASATEAHAIVIYEGRGSILVTVAKTQSPVELFLSSQRGAQWRLQLEPGARLKRVVALGAEPQQVAGVPAGVAIEGNAPGPQRGAAQWIPFPPSPQQMGMVTERLSAMTSAPVKTIQTAYTGTQFRISPDGKPVAASATDPRMAIPGMPYGYPVPQAPLPQVRIAPGGVGAAVAAPVPAQPGVIGGPALSGSRSLPLAPSPTPAARALTPAPTPRLGMARCGSSTIVCPAGTESVMCNGQPVACR